MGNRKPLIIPNGSNWVLIQDYSSCDENWRYKALVMCTLCFRIMEIDRGNISTGKSKQCAKCGRKLGAKKRKVDPLILPENSNFELIKEWSSYKTCNTYRGVVKIWKSKVRCKLCGDVLEVRRQNLKSGKTLQCNSCSRRGKNHHSYNRKDEFRESISKTMRENPENLSGYIDGRCSLEKRIRKHYRYKDWVNDVYKRDNYICQATGETNCRLAAHHIKPISQIIEENDIQTIDDAIVCNELWDINNGITYSAAYHIKLHREQQ